MKEYKLSSTLMSDKISSLTIIYDFNKPYPHWEIEQLQADQLDAFILTLRLFLQDNEVISIKNISEIIAKLEIDSSFKEIWNTKREKFNEYLDSSAILLDSSITNREILNTILYGDLAHLNKKYRNMIELWKNNQDMGIDVFAQFFNILKTALMQLISFQNGVIKLLNANAS